ncbi:hypothetical protein QDK53_11090 [Amycolatopsis magusensis]|nr:hypothetical protein [Amycolatopsis magusensis]
MQQLRERTGLGLVEWLRRRDHGETEFALVVPVVDHRADRGRGELVAAATRAAGVQHEQDAADLGAEQHLAREPRCLESVVDVGGIGLRGEENVFVGDFQDFAATTDVHRHDVVGASVVVAAEILQQPGQLALGRIKTEFADVLVAELLGGEVDDTLPGSGEPGPIPTAAPHRTGRSRLRSGTAAVLRDHSARGDPVIAVGGRASTPQSRTIVPTQTPREHPILPVTYWW